MDEQGTTVAGVGVLVLFADETSFTCMTPEGHGFAAWITFAAAEELVDGVPTTVATISALLRAAGPLYEAGMGVVGHRMEDKVWAATLRALGGRAGAGPAAVVGMSRVCVDRRQRNRWSNVRHNALVRSAVAPLRRRPRPAGG